MKLTRKQIAFAALTSILLMLFSTAVVRAAPGEPPPARMSLVMAVVVGILYYASLSPWFANIGFTVLYRPLVAGTLVGLVMGRLGEGIAIGANINLLYLGWVAAGGAMPGDMGLAGYLGTALVLGGGLDVGQALAVAAPLGLLGGLTHPLRMSVCSIIPHWADRYAERADIKGVARSNYIYSQPFLFVLYAVPVALAAYLGSAVVGEALGWIAGHAQWVVSGLFVASGMLAALGIGLNLKFLLCGSVWPYFFAGFAITSLMRGDTALIPDSAGRNVNLLVLAIIAGCVAYLHVLFGERAGEGQAEAAGESRPAPGLLSKRDVFGAWLRWLFFSHAAWNWERMQGLGFAHSMTPIIAKLYKSKDDIRAALKRHLVFFNTQPDMGGMVNGVVIAMEEERAAGAPITDEGINAIKTGLMGPLAGIGDTIQQGIVIPIALAIGMGLATGGAVGSTKSGSILGPLFYLVVVAAFVWGGGWFVWWQGYRQGRAAVTGILKSGTLNRVIVGAGVLGNMIMGAMAVSFVKLATPVAFVIGGSTFQVQSILSSFMPNLLPLLLVLLVWWLLARKQVSPTLIMIVLILAGVLGAYPIWPGLDAQGAFKAVGLFG